MLLTTIEEDLRLLTQMNLVAFATDDDLGFITSEHPLRVFRPRRRQKAADASVADHRSHTTEFTAQSSNRAGRMYSSLARRARACACCRSCVVHALSTYSFEMNITT